MGAGRNKKSNDSEENFYMERNWLSSELLIVVIAVCINERKQRDTN
jgi:hypothetical protein